MGLLRMLQQRRVCGEEVRFVTVVGHALGQNKQNNPQFRIGTPWWLAAPLMREAVLIQGPWGVWAVK